MTTTEAQFSIAEKEEVVISLRAKYVRAKHNLVVASVTLDEAKLEYERLSEECFEAGNEYRRVEDALLEQMAASL